MMAGGVAQGGLALPICPPVRVRRACATGAVPSASTPAGPEDTWGGQAPVLPRGGALAGGLAASWVASLRESYGGASASAAPLDDASLTSLLLPHARRLSVPPVSRFPVGAVGLGESGRCYLGANLELRGLPLSHSVHAEQALVASAMRAGETRLTWVATTAPPCGHCRQFLNELGGSDGLQLVAPGFGVGSRAGKGDARTRGVALPVLLPHRFGPEDLLGEGHRGLLSHGPLRAELEVGDLHTARGDAAGTRGDADVRDAAREEARAAAFDAARLSYAPYTGCPSGVSVVLADGRVFSGSYVECAAYNPSLPPLQAALSAAVIDGGCLTPPPLGDARCDGGGGDGEDAVRDFRSRAVGTVDWASPGSPARIVHACVVERHGAEIAQAPTVRLVLGEIAPGCSVEVCGLRLLSDKG